MSNSVFISKGKQFAQALLGTVSAITIVGVNAQAQIVDQSAPEDEIVVTASKIGKSLHDVAASVTVLTSDDLEGRGGLSSLSDVTERLANIVFVGKNGQLPTVRGVDGSGPAIGGTAFFAGTRNRLNIQVDGRALSFNEAAYGDPQMWDVAQVEVLRGSQSTLQGRNASAGTIAIISKNPTFDFEASLRAIVGTQSTKQISAAVSGPIIEDQVAFRLSADRREYESTVNFPASLTDAKDLGQFTANTLRAKLLIEPSALEKLRVLLTVNNNDFRGVQSEGVSQPYSERISAIGGGAPVHDVVTTSGTADISWEFNDNLTWQTLLSTAEFKFKRFSTRAPARSTGTEYAFETRLNYNSDSGRLNGVAGLYYFDKDQDDYIVFFGDSNYDDMAKTKAIFAEFDYAATDQLTLTFGARYEEEEKVRLSRPGTFFAVDLDQTVDAFLPKVGVAYKISGDTTIGASISRGYNGGGAGFTFEPPFQNFVFEPEYVWNYEAYARSQLSENIFLTGNVFQSNFEDMQIPFNQSLDPTRQSLIILNADKVTITGAELGMTWQASDDIQVYGDVGVLSTDIDSPGSIIDGMDLARAAGFTGNFGVLYKPENGFEFGGNLAYTGRYFSEELNDPRGKTDGRIQANAQLAYNWDKVRLFVSANNILDSEKPVQFQVDTRDPSGSSDNAILLAERRVMAGIQVNF